MWCSVLCQFITKGAIYPTTGSILCIQPLLPSLPSAHPTDAQRWFVGNYSNYADVTATIIVYPQAVFMVSGITQLQPANQPTHCGGSW